MLPLPIPFSSAGAVSGSSDALMKRVWAQGQGAGEPWCPEACMPGLSPGSAEGESLNWGRASQLPQVI